MPWQRLVADVACEVDPATGLPAYREVRVTVPRQSGKTTLFLAWQINRCVSKRWRHPQRSVFTAQTGKDARDKWLDELFPLIRTSAIRSLVARKGSRLEINEGMGNESIRFRTGSIIRLLSTSTTSGHSKTLHQAVMDEVWHDTDDRREQGLRPAMITMPDAQLLVCSTAGTDASVVLNRKVETGRAAVAADVGSGVAYFEWSAPEEWDPFDDGSFYGFHPALCPDPPCRCAPPGQRWRHTISIKEIRAERDAMELPEFCRAYGNRKPSHAVKSWQLFPEASWLAREDAAAVPAGRPAIVVDVTPDRATAAVGAAASRRGGGRLVDVFEHRPGGGVRWVLGALKDLDQQYQPAVIVVNDKALADEAEQAGLTVHRASAGDVAAGASALYDGVAGADEVGRDVWHKGRPELTDAAAGATTRTIAGTQSWAYDRSDLTVDISPLVAVSIAVWALGTPRIHRPARVPMAAYADVSSVVPAGARRARPAQPAGEAVDVGEQRLAEQIERDMARSGR